MKHSNLPFAWAVEIRCVRIGILISKDIKSLASCFASCFPIVIIKRSTVHPGNVNKRVTRRSRVVRRKAESSVGPGGECFEARSLAPTNQRDPASMKSARRPSDDSSEKRRDATRRFVTPNISDARPGSLGRARCLNGSSSRVIREKPTYPRYARTRARARL